MTKKEWLIAVILTFITICAWVVFDMIHTRSQTEMDPAWKEAIEPINPEFNLEAFDE